MKGLRLIAVLLIGACPVQPRAESLGRLFHSAAERNALDTLRKKKTQPLKPAPRIDGYVIRSDGRSTSWVNGSAIAGPR